MSIKQYCWAPRASLVASPFSLRGGWEKPKTFTPESGAKLDWFLYLYDTYMIIHPNSQPNTQTHTTYCAPTMINTIDIVASSEALFHVPGRSFLIFSTTYINLKCLHTPLGLIPGYTFQHIPIPCHIWFGI